jgi:hypothetical protein
MLGIYYVLHVNDFIEHIGLIETHSVQLSNFGHHHRYGIFDLFIFTDWLFSSARSVHTVGSRSTYSPSDVECSYIDER